MMKMPMTTHFAISCASVGSTTFPKRRPSVAMTAATMIAVQMAKRLQNTRLSISSSAKPTLQHHPATLSLGTSSRLQLHHIHIRIPLHEAKRLIHRVGLRTSGVRGEAKVDGSEFIFGKVDDALQEGAADPLAPIGRQNHDILDTRLPPRRRLKDTQGGASDNMLLIVLRDENPGSRRRHRTLLLQRRNRQIGIQLFHKSQQIIDLGFSQSTKFKVSHSIWEIGYLALSSTSYTELLLLYSGTICFILRTVSMLSNCLAISTRSSISRETSS